jgi:hypothetical protein
MQHFFALTSSLVYSLNRECPLEVYGEIAYGACRKSQVAREAMSRVSFRRKVVGGGDVSWNKGVATITNNKPSKEGIKEGGDCKGGKRVALQCITVNVDVKCVAVGCDIVGGG